MSSYTAIIHCENCKKVLATIEAYHKNQIDTFVPQDIMVKDYELPKLFCENCLNGITDAEQGGDADNG